MGDITSRFESAALQVKSLSERPDNQTLLKLYALYKQATLGDVSGDRPGISDIVARFKYDAWNELQGMRCECAMEEYAGLVTELVASERPLSARRHCMPPMRLIVNPTSGRGTSQESLPAIRKMLSELGVEHGLVITERPWHAAELARAAVREGCEVVVAVGGDGTANEVLNGLMQAKEAGEGQAALGLLCVGRGNDMAFGLKLPQDLEEGCAVLARGNRRVIDVGLVRGGLYPEGRYFGNGVGIGFDAVVGFEALKMKRLQGFVSYLVAALKTIFLYFKAPTVEIEAEDLQLTMPALMVSVMNGCRMGGGFMMAPEALTDDGLFDLCIAREVSKARIFALITRFMAGSQGSHPSITTARSAHIAVRALEGVLPAHADGETLCTEGTILELEILPAALEIVCPTDPREASS